jgi:RND family efflux transporter MFP subunit
VYARTEGYVEKRNVDIGSKVKAGQVLAVISSPEVDQQSLQARATLAQSEASLQQARAALGQAKANAELTRLTMERDLPLGQQHAISQQIVDEAVQANNARLADVAAAEATITAAQANVVANRANVARLDQLRGFEQVVAPFDGVITARNVERGDLVTTGSASAGKPLFAIAQSGTLRIQIDVPQSEAVHIQDGQKAILDVKERLGREYVGTVIRSAGSLDSAARTMLTEVQVDNRDGSLLPGMYAQVKFTLAEPHNSIIIPTSSLVIDHGGMHVVTVAENHKIHMVPVVIGRDMGTQIEVLRGIGASDTLVSSPSDLLQDGQEVEVR